MNHTDRGTLAHARRLAVQAHKGRILTVSERATVAYWVDKASPENFYMDGELFAN